MRFSKLITLTSTFGFAVSSVAAGGGSQPINIEGSHGSIHISQCASVFQGCADAEMTVNINGDGKNVIHVVGGGKTTVVKGADGKDGKDGKDGRNGLNGKDGKNGLDGTNGRDGVDGLNGTNGLNGKDGVNGKDGKNGKDGLNGKDGAAGMDGRNGLDGKDGKDGKDGLNGANGLDGKDGKDGLNGANGLNGTDGIDGKDGRDGLDGKDGKDGLDGKDGRDGKDADMSVINSKIDRDEFDAAVSDHAAQLDAKTSALTAESDKRYTTLVSGMNQVKSTGEYAVAQTKAANEAIAANRAAVEATDARVAHNTAVINKHSNQISALEQNTKNRFTALDNKVNDNRKRASAAISGVAAMANIPQVTEYQRFSVGAGVGSTDGESALAVGFSARATDSIVIKATVSADTQNNFVVGAGASYGW